MKGGLGNIMKQAQKMQENLQKAQAEIASLEIAGESGGGLVSVLMTGRYEVRRIRIDDSLVGDHLVAGLEVDAAHPARHRRRHDEHVAHACFAFVRDADHQRAALDLDEVDGHGCRPEQPRQRRRECEHQRDPEQQSLGRRGHVHSRVFSTAIRSRRSTRRRTSRADTAVAATPITMAQP